MGYIIEQEHPHLALLVINAMRLVLPDLYDAIMDCASFVQEIKEEDWNRQNNPDLLRLQDDILDNLCKIFKSSSGFRRDSTRMISHQRRSKNSNTRKAKSDSLAFTRPIQINRNGNGFTRTPKTTVVIDPEISEEDEPVASALSPLTSVEFEGLQSEGEQDSFGREEDYPHKDRIVTSIEKKKELPDENAWNHFYLRQDSNHSSVTFSIPAENEASNQGLEPYFKPLPLNVFDSSNTHKNNWPTFDEFEVIALSTIPAKQIQDRHSNTSNNSIKNSDFYEKERNTVFICPLCLDHRIPLNRTMEMGYCLHRICINCIKKHITQKIHRKEMNPSNLKCPIGEVFCQPIPAKIIQTTVDNQESILYNEYLSSQRLEYEVLHGLGMRCPNGSCKNVYLFNSIGEKVASLQNRNCGWNFVCRNGCNRSFCINCPAAGFGEVGPSHQPLACQRYQERLQTIPAAKKKYDKWRKGFRSHQFLQKEELRACPVCGIMIQRRKESDHLHCNICKCNFCYVCGKYNRLNPTERGDCGRKHGSSSLIPSED